MGLKSIIFKLSGLEDALKRIEIENSLDSEERKGLNLINYYSRAVINATTKEVQRGYKLPSPIRPCYSPPSPLQEAKLIDKKSVYEEEEKYRLMKSFLEKYPEYKSPNAKTIRKFYGL